MVRVRDGADERILSMDEFEYLVRRGDISPFAEVCLPAITGDRFVPARELPLFTSMYDPRRLLFQRHFHLGRLPLITGLLAVTCVGAFLVARGLGDGVVTREALIALGAKARSRIVDEGELWRLLIANFLHRDVTHLAFNLFALLNIGTVLEGVYRRADYVLLLVIGGVASMGLSTLASGPVTVGASGVVFCCLGAAVVFGLRFSEMLPLRYRLYFGVVVVGYAAVMFYLGLQRPTTDNWGHAGGLIAGLVMGALLEPRLMRLKDARDVAKPATLSWAASLVLIAAVALGGPVVPRLFFSYTPYRFDMFGIELWRPSTWSKGPDPLGFLAFGNGVDALTSIACAHVPAGRSLEIASQRFVDDELRALARAGHIGDLEVRPLSATTVADAPASEVPFSFVASDGAFEARAYVFLRGENECAFVLAHRAAASVNSRAILDEIRARLRFCETKAERDGRNAVLNRPNDPRAHLDLALAHQASGDFAGARTEFEKAGELAARDPVWTARIELARARMELRQGQDLDAALAAAGRAIAVRPEDPDTAVLWVDVLLRRGEGQRARDAVAAALKAFPDEPRLHERRTSAAALP